MFTAAKALNKLFHLSAYGFKSILQGSLQHSKLNIHQPTFNLYKISTP